MKAAILTRRLIRIIGILLALIIIFPVAISADISWNEDQLVEDEAFYLGHSPQIALDGLNAVAVWFQSDGSSYRIYSNYSADGGATWHTDQLIEDNAGYNGFSPQITLVGLNAVVIWCQSDGTSDRIYSNYSTDGGATWHSDQLIENNAGYDGDGPQIVLDGLNAVAVWYQSDGTNNRIYSNYSTDGGAVWHSDQLIEDNAGYNGFSPQIALDGLNAVVVWKQFDGTNSRIYSNYSSNGGAAWHSDQLVENNAGYTAENPQITLDGLNTVAVWEQDDGSNTRVYRNYSTDGGATWQADQVINSVADGNCPQISLDGLNAVAVWFQFDGSNLRIYRNYSTDSGVSWQVEQLIEDNAGFSGYMPQIAIDGLNAVVVWYQSDGTSNRIYSNYSSDGGANWQTDQLIEDNAGFDGVDPQIALDGLNAVAVWEQSDDASERIYSNYSSDGGANWQTDQLIEDNTGYAGNAADPQVAMDGLNVVAVWSQSDGSSDRIYSNYSSDGGVTWQTSQLIENNAGFNGAYPQISLDGLNAVAVWYQSDGTNNRIYSNYSSDGGATWQTAQLIEDNAGFDGADPQIALVGLNAVAVWYQSDGSSNRIYSNYSSDGGATWQTDQLIEDNAGFDGNRPQIALAGLNSVAVWEQYDGTSDRIYSNYSADSGATWQGDQLIENNAGYGGGYAQIALSGLNAVAVWDQYDGTRSRVYSNISTDSGATWETEQIIDDTAGGWVCYPQIALDGLNAVAVWCQSDGTSYRIYSNYSSDGGTLWQGARLIEDNTGYEGNYPQIALSGLNTIVVWYQSDGTGDRIYSNYSPDGGATWQGDQLIEDNAGNNSNAADPQIALVGLYGVAVWEQVNTESKFFPLYNDSIYSNHTVQQETHRQSAGGEIASVQRFGILALWLGLALLFVTGIIITLRLKNRPGPD